MSIELAAKTKKSELWIAAGGDKMTSVVSIYQNDMVLAGRIVISGAADNDNRYIANVIAAATVGDGLKNALPLMLRKWYLLGAVR